MAGGKEVLPNPGDVFQSIRYLQDQAARGHFDRNNVAYAVLTYLVTNMWVKVPNKEDAPLGMVMYGRSGIETIAACTVLSERSVQRALAWLAEQGWIDTERSFMDSGRESRRYISVLLDARGHRDRARKRELDGVLAELTGEGDSLTPSRGDSLTPSQGDSLTPPVG